MKFSDLPLWSIFRFENGVTNDTWEKIGPRGYRLADTIGTNYAHKVGTIRVRVELIAPSLITWKSPQE